MADLIICDRCQTQAPRKEREGWTLKSHYSEIEKDLCQECTEQYTLLMDYFYKETERQKQLFINSFLKQ